MRVLSNRVLIEADPLVNKRGIIMPETTDEKSTTGVVIEVGPGDYHNGVFVKPDIKIGDRVLFGKFAGTDVVVNDKKLLIMREQDIYLVL